MVSGISKFMVGASTLALMMAPCGAAAQEATETTKEGVENVSGSEPEEIVVQGFRASIETANRIKKESDQIVDSIVAEDIGKLPDQTGAESLARVMGISVERGTGEAAAIRLRGLPDLTTTYNGRELFTAEGRSVALQDFPSGTISRFDVYKTSASNLIEAGIAGEIDVRSRKPFDFKDFRMAGGITGLHWQNSQRLGLDANLLISKRWNTGIGEIGILVEGSYTDNKFVDDHRTNSNVIQTRPANAATFPGAQYPAVLTLQPDVSNRFRPSAGAAVQWRPSPELEFYSDFLFQGFRGRGRGYGLQINAGTGATLSDVVYCPGSTTQVCQMTARGGNATSAYQAGQASNTNTYQAGGGFVWTPDNARISGDFAYTDSVFASQNFQVAMTTLATGTRVFNFDDPAGGGGGSANVTDIDLTNPANWRYSGFSQADSRNHGRSYQAKLDAEMPVELGVFDKVQVGLRFNDRAADSEALANDPATGTSLTSGTINAGTPGSLLTAAPLELTMVDPTYKDDPTDHPRTWVTPTRQSVIDYADYIRAMANNAVLRSAGFPARTRNYQSSEKSYATYLQTHYGFEVGGIEIDGQLGLRAVRTETQINGLRNTARVIPNPNPGPGQPATITVRESTPISRDKEYSDLLPNISARLRFTPQLQARLSFTKTRTRPSFGQLNPTISYNIPLTGNVTASSGNPDLEPIRSTNYDASLEYYFSRSGAATVQIFQRDIVGFINNRSLQFQDPDLGPVILNQPENGEEGRIRGVEAGVRTFFDFEGLPQWARNFGVLANYTYLDHWSVLSQAVQATLPGRQPITNVSKHLANAQIFYENKNISLRASYNYRSSFQFYSQIDAAVGTLPTVEQGRGTLDLSAGINPTPNLSVTLSATNVLGDPARNSRQFTRAGAVYPWQVRYLESVYRLGLRFRF